MEGLSIYESSKAELDSIKKSIATGTIVINTKNLDGNTKDAILKALNGAINERYSEVSSIILGVR